MNTIVDTPATTDAGTTRGTTWIVTWEHGPDAGGRRVLGPGRHVVGRSCTADVRCDDPLLDRHAGTLELRPDGSATFTPFAGGPSESVGGDGLMLGDSHLTVRPGGPLGGERANVAQGALVRRPRSVPRLETVPLPDVPPPPAARERPGGLLPAVLGLAGAGAMALLLHQPMFVLFGAIGSCVALGSWGTQWVAARRRHLHALGEHRDALVAHARVAEANRAASLEWHQRRVPALPDALATAATHGAALWERRTDHPDAFIASIGTADGVPVDASFADGDRLAMLGDDAPAVARSIVAQLTSSCGPADLRIVVVTEQPQRWHALASLPHVVLPDASPAIVDEAGLQGVLELLGAREHAHLLVVTDSARALATRTSQLRRLLTAPRVALLAAFEPGTGAPHLCTAVLHTEHGTGWWTNDTSADRAPLAVRVAGLGALATATHATALASLHDPEDVLAADMRIPRQVPFADVVEPLGTNPAGEIVRRWNAARDATPRTPIGRAADGIVDVDLVRDGPHGLLAGTTGSGKSELLRTLVAGLALHTSPERLAVILVDYKGGATFDALVRLPHVVGVITDLDGHLADRALRSLHAELRRREALLREHGVADLTVLHTRHPEVALPRLLVVIDEFAALVAEQPDFLHALVGVAQRGRSLGVHLLLATQRPHGVISDDIRANTDLRIALRLLDQADAMDVVGDRTPATLPRTVPGRGVLRLGADEHLGFQTAHLPTDEIDTLVRHIIDAAALAGSNTPAAPWLPPLPRRVRPLDLPADALGLCDDPDHQAHVPLRWTPADGDVLVVGSAGSGRSSALRLLADATLEQPDTHVYVLHAGPSCGPLPDAHPRATAVDVNDRELTTRLLHRLRHRDDGPASSRFGTGSMARTVLVVDDLDEVRRAVDDAARTDEHDALDAVLADTGLRLIVAATRPSAVPTTVLARCAHRWVLHLHDPMEAGVLGARCEQTPPPIPGRAFVLPAALEAQLAQPRRRPRPGASSTSPAPTVEPLPPIEPLPARLQARDLPAGRRGDDADLLTLGVDAGSGAPSLLEVPEGEHVLVLGAARCGRSTTLTRLVVAWRDAHPDGVVAAVLPRRSALDRHHVDHLVPASHLARISAVVDAAAAEHHPVLVVVDDAELVDDVEGVLARLAALRRPRCTIVAAARPDAIRQVYGHWTGVVRRSRLGIIATGGTDTDGDLLGVLLPRRAPIGPRPGLVWVADRGRVALAQVALDTAEPADRLSLAN